MRIFAEQYCTKKCLKLKTDRKITTQFHSFVEKLHTLKKYSKVV